MSYILRTHGLVKCFNNNEVINHVNINIKQGEIYGFLGPNGAGKTTVMKMIMGLVEPTSGSIEMFGKTVQINDLERLKRIGAIIENPIFYDKLSARENLELHCEYMGYYNKKEIDEVLKLVNLQGINNKAVGYFSLGMRQRLALARAILTKPEILILDEPINGLDPEGIAQTRSLLKMLCKEYGMTIMISSHILAEIEQIADTIGVLSGGKLIKEVTLDQIHQREEDYIEVVVDDIKQGMSLIEINLGIKDIKMIDTNVFRVYSSEVTINDISKLLITNGIMIESISQKKASLEEYFLKLVKGEGIHV